MTRAERLELLRELCLAFGPTGCEHRVTELITEKLTALGYESYTDRIGNVVVHLPCENAPRVMVSAHADEVGFIIREITEDGYLKFSPLGGIDPRVLCGKHVTVETKSSGLIQGVIASKAIHHQSPEDRKTATPIKNMYIDIGAKKKDEVEEIIELGCCATFDSKFIIFGTDGAFIKGKAIDDRLGCAEMLYVLEKIKGRAVPLDLWFCFTVREEIGLSGALTAANSIRPDYAIVVESTAVSDLPNVPENSQAAKLGKGGAISIRDRSTIYDRGFVRFVMELAEKEGIPAQIKRYVSGGNDAGRIHKSGSGVRCLAVSAPSRYLHSPACVVSTEDYLSMGELVYGIITNFNEEEIKNA